MIQEDKGISRAAGSDVCVSGDTMANPDSVGVILEVVPATNGKMEWQEKKDCDTFGRCGDD